MSDFVESPSPADDVLQSAKAALDQANAARREFDAADKRINDSSAATLEAFSRLATEKPEEVFGLKPTDRERYFVSQVLVPVIGQVAQLRGIVEAAASLEGTVEIDLSEGAEGSAGPAAVGIGALLGGEAIEGLFGALGELVKGISDVLKSPQGPEVLDKIFGHVQKEKQFVKDTVKDGIQGLTGIFGLGGGG
jgi:hypothetical protein